MKAIGGLRAGGIGSRDVLERCDVLLVFLGKQNFGGMPVEYKCEHVSSNERQLTNI